MSDTTQAEEAAMYRWLRDRGEYFVSPKNGAPSPWAVCGTGHWDAAPCSGSTLDAAIRQAMVDDAALTDRIGAALAAPGSERLRDYYATGPVQRASVETFVAALGVASLQSVASAETCRDAAGVAPAHPTQPEQPR
mgnify:FL=1